MNLEEIKVRINPQYADTIGTESHERKWLCDEIKSMRQQLANSQKREVMLRNAVLSMMRDTGLVKLMRRDQVERNNDALAATEPKP